MADHVLMFLIFADNCEVSEGKRAFPASRVVQKPPLDTWQHELGFHCRRTVHFRTEA